MSVELRPFYDSHLPALAEWLRAPHVARWYPAALENLEWAAAPPDGGDQAIICCDGHEVGYLRWQRVSRSALDQLGLHEVPGNSVDADILLGTVASVGKRVGVDALRLLVELLRQDPAVPLIGLTTELENHRAHRAFERAGFRKVREYVAPVLGRCYLMVFDLRSA